MSKSDTAENAILKLIFNATTWANVAINDSAPATNIYVALHTADPGESGTQTTSEAAYTSYARVAVARSGSGWTVTGSSVSPVAAITFPACTGSTATCTFFSVGLAATGANTIYYSGAISPSISVSTGVTPQLTTATAITED